MQSKKNLALLAAIFSASLSFGQKVNEVPSFRVTISAANSGNGFSLQISNPEKKKLKLEISHSGFGAAVDTVIMSETFTQRYNMEQADDGRYTVKVACGKVKILREVELTTITRKSLEVVKRGM